MEELNADSASGVHTRIRCICHILNLVIKVGIEMFLISCIFWYNLGNIVTIFCKVKVGKQWLKLVGQWQRWHKQTRGWGSRRNGIRGWWRGWYRPASKWRTRDPETCGWCRCQCLLFCWGKRSWTWAVSNDQSMWQYYWCQYPRTDFVSLVDDEASKASLPQPTSEGRSGHLLYLHKGRT